MIKSYFILLYFTSAAILILDQPQNIHIDLKSGFNNFNFL